MKREDVIRLAEQAGFSSAVGKHIGLDEDLQRFAALVAAAEREACARVAELVAREIDDTNGTATYIAKGIRARGNT